MICDNYIIYRDHFPFGCRLDTFLKCFLITESRHVVCVCVQVLTTCISSIVLEVQ